MPLLVAAVAIADAYAAVAPPRDVLVERLRHLQPTFAELERGLRAFTLARCRGWEDAARRVRRRLCETIDELRRSVDDAAAWTSSADDAGRSPRRPPVTPASVHAELRAAMAEFGGAVRVVRGTADKQAARDALAIEPIGSIESIAVVTPQIELAGVTLGRFTLMLHLDALRAGRFDGRALQVEALDPRPASSDETVVHPHVRDGDLCLGDGAAAFRRALEQGRLCDAWLVAWRVLSTYNAGSAYVSLDD